MAVIIAASFEESSSFSNKLVASVLFVQHSNKSAVKMNRKVASTSDSNYRPNRPKRRRYYGNQFESLDAETASSDASEGISASAKKMKGSATDVTVTPTHCYRIIEFISIFSAISDMSVCKKCKRQQTFGSWAWLQN